MRLVFFCFFVLSIVSFVRLLLFSVFLSVYLLCLASSRFRFVIGSRLFSDLLYSRSAGLFCLRLLGLFTSRSGLCLFCFGLFVLRASPQGFLFFSGLFVLRASPQGLLFFFGLFVLRASPQGSRFIHCCLFVLRASPQGLVLSLYSCEFRFSVRFLMFCFRFFRSYLFSLRK